MTGDATDWHRVLARVTGELVRGEQRVTTYQLLTEHLGIPVSDRACRRLKRVMRELGWRGPRKMRWGERTTNGYWRHPTVGVPAIVPEQPAVEVATVGEGTLAPELDRVTRLALQKIEQILRIPTDRSDGNLLRAQTAAAGIVVNAQLRVDESKMRPAPRKDFLVRLLAELRQDRAEREEAAREAFDEEQAKMKQEQARGPLREVPQLDVSHEKDADGEAAE